MRWLAIGCVWAAFAQGADLVGIVWNADARPVPNARLTVQRLEFRDGRTQLVSTGRTATADPGGSFRIANVPNGRYHIRAEDPAATSFNPQASLLPSQIERNLPATVTVDAVDDAAPIEIAMKRGFLYTLRGRVTGEGQAQVNVFDETGASVDFVNAQAETGEFLIEYVPAGRYTLLARTTPGRGAGPESPARTFARAEVQVTGDVENLELKLQPGVNVEGRITNDGALRTRPRIGLLPAEATAAPVESLVEESGRFTNRNVAPLKYFVVVAAPGAYVKSVSPAIVDLRGGTAPAIEVQLSTKGSTLTGKTAGAAVTVWPRTPGAHDSEAGIRSVAVDAQGEFAITDLAPGEYFAVSWEQIPPAHLIQFPAFLSRMETLATLVSLRETEVRVLEPPLISKEIGAGKIAQFP